MSELKLQVFPSQPDLKQAKLGVLVLFSGPVEQTKDEFIKFKELFNQDTFFFCAINLSQMDATESPSQQLNKAIVLLAKSSSFILMSNFYPNVMAPHLMKWIHHTDHNQSSLLCSKPDPSNSTQFLLCTSHLWMQIGGCSLWLYQPHSIFNEFIKRAHYKRVNILNTEIQISKKSLELPEDRSKSWAEKENEFKDEVYPTQNHLIHRKPSFIVLGAQKAGSTTLINNISTHPEIHIPQLQINGVTTREIHFFDGPKYKKLGTPWYYSLFYHPKKKCSGEKTPEYLPSKESHARIHNTLPKVKLFVSLRNPVDRAYSAIQHIRRLDTPWGPQDLKEGSSEEAFDLLCEKHLDSFIITCGHYAEHLESLLSYFPKEQLKIFINEYMSRDHKKIYREIFETLNVNPNIPIPEKKYFVGNYEDTRSPKTLEKLKEYYRPHNERLFNLLGFEIPEWT